MYTALININDIVCCSLDIGGCIAAETYSLCSLLTYSLYFISFDQIIVLQMLQLYVKNMMPYHIVSEETDLRGPPYSRRRN